MNANYKKVDYNVDKPLGSMNNIRPICKYAGSKTRLLFYILYAAFLTCTSTFYDLCGGSGVVTMNLLDCVNRKIINDISVVHAVIFKELANEHMVLKLDDLLYNGFPTWQQYVNARKYWYTNQDAKLSDIPAEELVHAAYCGLLLLWGERLGSDLNIGTPIDEKSNKQTVIMNHIKSQWISYRKQRFDRLILRLEDLISRINLTNSKTVSDGKTITEILAERDCQKKKIEILRNFLNNASNKVSRMTRTEIKIISTVPVSELQNDLDELSKKHRKTEERIQELNWTTELI